MLILIKIHKAEYIEDMFENEYLYFSSLKNFRSLNNDNTCRFDPRELNLKNVQLTTLTASTGDKEIHLHQVFKNFSGQYMEYLGEPNINCCSLHWLEIEPCHPPSKFSRKLLEMGDKSLLIYDWEKFFKLIDSSIENIGLKYSRKKIEYYDPKKFNGYITLHHKDEEYCWQNEYRILIAPTDDHPIKLPLKGLKEISWIIETKNLEGLRFEINAKNR